MTQCGSLRFDGKVAIVTGGARGIGAATVQRLVYEGCQVVIADVLDDFGHSLAVKVGKRARYVHLDVTDEAQWHDAVEFACKIYGPPDVLVSNAGIMIVRPLEETTTEDFQRAFNVNTLGAFYGIRAVIDSMRCAGEGAIVTVSSTAGATAVAGMAAYCASKAANAMIARVGAIELGKYGIRINTVYPGLIDTDMSNSEEVSALTPIDITERLPISRLGTPEDVARLIAFMASPEAGYITGCQYVVDGGMLAAQ